MEVDADFPIEDTDLELRNAHAVVSEIVGGWIWNDIEEILRRIPAPAAAAAESCVVLWETGRDFCFWKLCNIEVMVLTNGNEAEGLKGEMEVGSRDEPGEC